jgi:hypothetical protein
MNRKKVVIALSLIIINSILGASALFNFLNIENSLFNPSPPNQNYAQSFNLNYPPQMTGGGVIIGGSNGIKLNIDVALISTGAFLVDKPIDIIAKGSGDPTFLSSVSAVSVGFAGAEPYGSNGYSETLGGSFAGVILYPNSTYEKIPMTIFLGENIVGEANQIKFANPQTYVLSLTILYKNISMVQYTYPSNTIFVYGSDYLTQPRESRFDYSIGIMAIFDIFVGVFTFAYNSFKSNNQSESTVNNNPDAKKPKPNRKASPKKPS